MKKFFKKIKFWWYFPDQWPEIWGEIQVRLNSTYTLNDEIRAFLVPEIKECIDYIKKNKEMEEEFALMEKKGKKGGKNAK